MSRQNFYMFRQQIGMSHKNGEMQYNFMLIGSTFEEMRTFTEGNATDRAAFD